MTTCASCSGRGTLTCSTCGGRRYISRLTASGDMDMSPCAGCGGKGHQTCPFCGGRGNVGSSNPAQAPAGRKRSEGEDVLAGRWNGPQGTSYEFVRRGKDYDVAEYGMLGRTGSGIARLEGNVVSLTVKNVLFGVYNIQLKLQGDTLRGALNILGVPTPMVLTRG